MPEVIQSTLMTLTNRCVAAGEWVSQLARRTATDGVVVDNGAASTEATRSRAGVDAAPVDTGLCLRAFGRHDALGTAGWRRASVVGQAGAGGVARVGHQAPAVGTAWRRVAGVDGLVGDGWRRAGSERVAVGERVTGAALRTEAYGHVVHHAAVGGHAARPGARVLALVVDAGLVHGAVRVEHALGVASEVGVPEEAGQALASRGAVAVPAASVGSALDLIAWLHIFYGWKLIT